MERFILFLGIVFLIIGCQRKNEITEQILTPNEIEQAIKYGKENANLTFSEFVKDWSIDRGYEFTGGKAVLITPFLRVALLSKNAEERNQKVDMKVINMVLKDISDKICFKVTLYGDYATFGRTAKFYLEYNGKKIQPISSFMAPYSQFARDYTHISEGEVKFSKKEIPEKTKVNLVVTFKPVEEDKEITTSFEFDLKKYK